MEGIVCRSRGRSLGQGGARDANRQRGDRARPPRLRRGPLARACRGRAAANHALTACTSTSRWTKFWLNDDEKAEIKRWDIVLDHAYSIVAADEKAKTVDLRNPWGNHHISGLPWSVFRHYMYSWSEVKVR